MATTDAMHLSQSNPHAFRPPPGPMSEGQFVAWCDEQTRAEWVDGDVQMMTPANVEHVQLSGWLYRVCSHFVEMHDLGVVLQEMQIRSVAPPSRRVPDVLFLARERLHLLRETHVEGPPDLIVEIVSPDSPARDWREKYLEYEAAGVREYWVVDPGAKHVEVYLLAAAGDPPRSAYRRTDEAQDVVQSTVLAGLAFPKAWLWTPTRPKVIDALRSLRLLGEKEA